MNVALVSYLNTKPFLHGLESYLHFPNTHYELLAPSHCATHLLEKKAEIALIPIGSLGDFGKIHLLPSFCIGANKSVESVYLFAQRPVQELERIFLDPDSRTSNLLTQILFAHHWQIEVEFAPVSSMSPSMVQDRDGAVMIGDKAIVHRNKYVYTYDLATAWYELSGLPFVFAVWAYYPELISPDRLQDFENALRKGVKDIPQYASAWSGQYKIDPTFGAYYLSRCIDYYFDAPKHRALRLFMETAAELDMLKTGVIV